MTTALFKDGFPSAHRTTRQRIESSIDLQRLFFAIDADPALIGAAVVYIDEEFSVVILREFQAICSVQTKKVVLREAPKYVGPVEFKRMLEYEPRESELIGEVLNTAVTCTGALLSWVLISSGIMFMPFTGGASAVIAFVGKAAAVASSVQCISGVVRTAYEVYSPQSNDELNNNAWYEAAMIVLDGVALLGVATSALSTVKAVNTVTRVSGKPLWQVLRGLSRQERVKLNNELLSIRDPRLTTKLLKLERAAGRAPKRISAAEVQQSTVNHMRDALAATASFSSSVLSGNINTLAIGIYEEVVE